MKTKIAVSLIVGATMFANAAYADGSVQHSGQALNHSAQAITHGVVGGVKLTMGVAAIPFAVVGSVGEVSGDIGRELWQGANAPIGEPLPISDESVIVGPSPKEAMEVKGEQI